MDLNGWSRDSQNKRSGFRTVSEINAFFYIRTNYLATYRVTHIGCDFKSDDSKVKLGLLPWIQPFNDVFNDTAKKETSSCYHRIRKPAVFNVYNIFGVVSLRSLTKK